MFDEFDRLFSDEFFRKMSGTPNRPLQGKPSMPSIPLDELVAKRLWHVRLGDKLYRIEVTELDASKYEVRKQ